MMKTDYAPAERVAPEILEKQAQHIENSNLLKKITESMPNILVILNKERQIVYANKRLADVIGPNAWKQVKGKRPGEVLNCMRASESPGGCGTTEFCRTCGAVNAILEAQKGKQSVKECKILTKNSDAIDLRVWATPFEIDDQFYTIFAVTDIGDEKRREILERTFFHDILNTAGGISGLSNILQCEDDLDEITEIINMLNYASSQLIEEIQNQRQLLAAERGKLEVSCSKESPMALMREVVAIYSNHEAAKNQKLFIQEPIAASPLFTDPVLARRILGNMTKNALEATRSGDIVTLAYQEFPDEGVFSVHNSSYIKRNIQLQIFKRSFSTKGRGRGIGTYSIKLFGEKYLKGRVWFDSVEQTGTTFYLSLPRGSVCGQ